jgi:hypothetical protein
MLILLHYLPLVKAWVRLLWGTFRYSDLVTGVLSHVLAVSSANPLSNLDVIIQLNRVDGRRRLARA